MAIQIIPREPGIGELFGAGLGQGLSAGLGALANLKLGQIQQRQQQAQTFSALSQLGIQPELAQLISILPPEVQKNAFSNLGQLMQFSAGQQSGMSMDGQAQPQMSMQALQQPQMQEQQLPQQPTLMQRLSPLEQLQQQRAFDLLGVTPEMMAGAQQQMDPQVAPQQPMMQQPMAPITAPQPPEAITPPAVAQKRLEQLGELFKSPETRRREEELELRRKKDIREERKATAEETKATREFSKPYVERADAAEKNIRDYKTLANLSYKGDIRSGSFRGILDKLKMPWLYRNYTTELADKTIARLAQNASSAFGTGSRITNYLEQTFQRSLPSLWNTPEMIKTISEINMLADKGNVIVNNERSKLLKETGGIVPGNADDIIRERARPLLNRLEERALLIASNPVIKTPNPYELDAQGKQLYPDGSIIEIEGRVFEKEGRKWKPVYDDEFFFI